MKKPLLFLLVIMFISCGTEEEEFRTVTELPEIKLGLFFNKDGVDYFYNLSESKDSLSIYEDREKISLDTFDFFQMHHHIICPDFTLDFAVIQSFEQEKFDYTHTLFKNDDSFLDLILATETYDEPINLGVDTTKTVVGLSYSFWHAYASHEISKAELLKTEVVYFEDYAYVLFDAEFEALLVGGPFPILSDQIDFHGIISTRIRYPELDKI